MENYNHIPRENPDEYASQDDAVIAGEAGQDESARIQNERSSTHIGESDLRKQISDEYIKQYIERMKEKFNEKF
jgi:hypothetical protein